MKISNKRKKILLVFVLVVILFSFIVIGLIVKSLDKESSLKDKNDKKEEIIKEDNNYSYKINANATDYEKVLFKELEVILDKEEIEYESYANVLSKLFVVDLFTLSNKKSSNDITSVQYVYSDYKDNYKEIVKDSIYSYIELNLDGKRNQELPTVNNVEIKDVKRESFTFKNNIIDFEAFRISLNIGYEKDMGYPSSYCVILVKKDNLLYVVKSYEN